MVYRRLRIIRIAMNPTDTTIPNDWMAHGFCPRDLVPSLRLRKKDGKFVLQLTKAHWCLAIICTLLAIAMFAFWLVVRWGTESNDLQLKWIVFGAGCLFAIVGFLSGLTNYVFANFGQYFAIDTNHDLAIVKQSGTVESIPLHRIKGLQILVRGGDAQLNLLCEVGDGVERRWLHTDLHWHIELLAKAFGRDCKIPVVSRIDKLTQNSRAH